jgi:zeta-carotene desaturase
LQAPGGVRPNMLDWLRRHGQTEAAISRFWGVILVSALDEQLGRTDAQYGVDVFWKAFLANRSGYRVGIPTVPLAELYDGCRAALEARGGAVRLRAAVRKFQIVADAVAGVAFESGETLQADHYIAAVPHDVLLELLPSELVECMPAFANLRPPADAAVASGQYLQLVISASSDLVQSSRQEIVDLCLREIRAVLPAAREARLVKSTVVKEVAATFSPEPGCDRWRPAAYSHVGGMFLAGDWTATGWPATMEGAVRSGYLAAEAILAADGQPQKLVRPDLPWEGLSKLLARRAGGEA